MKKLYQTLEDRGNPDEVQDCGPFRCRTDNAWLGEGYYFWEYFIELAHFWGQNCRYSNYIICEATANLNDNNCYDLVDNFNHIQDFKNIFQLMTDEGLVNEKTTVRRIISFMQAKGLFQHSAIRVVGTNSIAGKEKNEQFTQRVRFDNKLPAFLDLIPPIQICILNIANVSLNDYSIVYPDIYVQGYVV